MAMTNRAKSDRKKQRAKLSIANAPTRLSPQPASAAPSANQGDSVGFLRPETDEPHIPTPELKKSIWSERPGRVGLTIFGLALIWIVIVTYYVAQMPPK